MKIKYIDGTDTQPFSGQNYVVYTEKGIIHNVVGLYVHKEEKGYTYKKVYFRKTRRELESNTIYIVKQGNKKQEFRTLIHELCHWIIARVGNFKYLHKLVDKKLK